MKKYNRLITLAVILYIALATAVGLVIYQTETNREKMYNVEINRIENSLSQGVPLDKLDLRSYRYIKKVTYILQEELGDREKVEAFYERNSLLQTAILPRLQGGQLVGYVRFDYTIPASNLRLQLLVIEGSLALMMAGALWILLYLKYKLVNPFNRMSKIPYQLAKGHLKGEVKEEKSRYFGRFIWGISQLKDTLDVTKKREIELEKERKQMLLSLSHDIKTPLNTIKLYSKALEEEIYQDEDKKHHAARQIGQKTIEIEKYIEEIIRTSREDILNIQVEKGEFYLEDLMENVLETYTEKCNIRKIDLQVKSYENCLLQGDMDKTQEVFENLFENAFKYGDGRQITITFYEEEYCHLIKVFNTGEPVSDNEFNHIFDSFFRGSNATGHQGNGLGLYICQQIMRKMDGEIFAQKEDGGIALILVFR